MRCGDRDIAKKPWSFFSIVVPLKNICGSLLFLIRNRLCKINNVLRVAIILIGTKIVLTIVNK